MRFFKYFLLAIVILALLDPTEGGWRKKKLKKLGRSVKKAVKGVVAGAQACHFRQSKCKRSAEIMEVILPFSDQMSDYDMNNDKLVTYEEFVFAVLRSVNLAEPEELREPFVFADFDGNGVLDTDEFKGAPFFFAHEVQFDKNVTLADQTVSTAA